jgi:hypothetical protein
MVAAVVSTCDRLLPPVANTSAPPGDTLGDSVGNAKLDIALLSVRNTQSLRHIERRQVTTR